MLKFCLEHADSDQNDVLKVFKAVLRKRQTTTSEKTFLSFSALCSNFLCHMISKMKTFKTWLALNMSAKTSLRFCCLKKVAEAASESVLATVFLDFYIFLILAIRNLLTVEETMSSSVTTVHSV